MGLCGTGKDHCCWMSGVQCPFVIESPDKNFQWACSLRLQEKNWNSVYRRDEYNSIVKPRLIEAGIQEDCGNWPPRGVKCNDCGNIG